MKALLFALAAAAAAPTPGPVPEEERHRICEVALAFMGSEDAWAKRDCEKNNELLRMLGDKKKGDFVDCERALLATGNLLKWTNGDESWSVSCTDADKLRDGVMYFNPVKP